MPGEGLIETPYVNVVLDAQPIGSRFAFEYITRTMPLDRITDAFDVMHRGGSIRSVIQC